MVATDSFESAMGRSSGAYVVLGMDLEEAALRPLRKDRGLMLVLETGSREAVDGMRKAERHRCSRGGLIPSVHRASPLPVILGACSDRLERSMLAVGQLDAGAGPALNELPRIALEIDGRGALAGRARTGCAIVLALQGDAEAFFLLGGHGRVRLGLGQGCGGGKCRKRGRNGTGEDEGTDNILSRHGYLLLRKLHRLQGEGASIHFVPRVAPVTSGPLMGTRNRMCPAK